MTSGPARGTEPASTPAPVAPAGDPDAMDPDVLMRGSRRFLGLAPEQVATILRVVIAVVAVLLGTIAIGRWVQVGLGVSVASVLVVTIPVVLGPLVWLAVRRGMPNPNGDHDAPRQLPAVLVAMSLLALAVFLVAQRGGADLPAAVELAWLAGCGILVLVSVPLSTQRWERVGAAVAGSLLFVAYVLFTTTTHAFYFGATDLMAFRPSLDALAAGATLDEALPEDSSGLYDSFPSYFLIGAAAAVLTGQGAMTATFQVYSVLYPAACLLLVAMLRRFGFQERVAWTAFLVALASRPFLADATYPTPRSLVFFFTVALLAIFVMAWRTPRMLGPGMYVLVAFLNILLAVMHKVSGIFAIVPIVATLAFVVPYMRRPAQEVRWFVGWTLGTLAAAYLAYALYVSDGLRDALGRVADTSALGSRPPAARPVNWSGGEVADFLAANLDVMLGITLAMVGVFMLLSGRGSARWRIHPVGVALIVYLSLQVAYYSPLWGLPAFDDFRLLRLAHGAMLYVSVAVALILVAVLWKPTQRPVGTAVTLAVMTLFVVASYGVASINQDLAISRPDNQYTITFDSADVTALAFGEHFTGDIHCDVLACQYYAKHPFMKAVTAKVYDDSVPLDRTAATLEKQNSTRPSPGFVLERQGELSSGFAQIVDKTGERQAVRLADTVPEYRAMLADLRANTSIVYAGGGTTWYVL